MSRLDLSRAPHLDLHSNDLDDAGLAALAPALADNERLHLQGNSFGPDGLRALGRSVRRLKFLCLSGWSAEIADPLVDVLLEEKGFRTLVRLHFLCDRQSVEGLTERLQKLPALRKLIASEREQAWTGDALSAEELSRE